METKKSIKSKIIAFLDGESSSEELQDLHQWINKSGENLRYFTQLKDIWEVSAPDVSEIAGTGQEWERFLGTLQHKGKDQGSKSGRLLNYWYRIAAVIIFAMLLGGAVMMFSNRTEPVYLTATAPRGSISQIVLPDSTLIYLNAGSEIKYNIGENQKRQEVSLNGEAWFHVRAQKNKPFVVHTGTYDVRVMGTEFNVKAYEADMNIETTLEKGSVVIVPKEKSGKFKMLELSPGEQLIFNKSSKSLSVKEVNAEKYSAWKDNKLIFINMKLEELIVVLERKFGVDINVENSAILQYHYYGTIRNETIIEILELLKKTLPISYRIVDQKIEIIEN